MTLTLQGLKEHPVALTVALSVPVHSAACGANPRTVVTCGGSRDSTGKAALLCFTGSTQPDVVGFFNGALLAVNAQTGFVKEEDEKSNGEQLLPVERCEVFNESSRFCFLELRNEGYTVLCIKLDGRCHNGLCLHF